MFLVLYGCGNSDGFNNEEAVMLHRTVDETFRYEVMPPMGNKIKSKEGGVLSLLKDTPYLFISNVIPSEKVLNLFLASGISDAGMSGGVKWEPFVLLSGEFIKLVDRLTKENKNLNYISPPDWVNNKEDWNVWIMYVKLNVPWEEHKSLNDSYISIIEKMNNAYERGNKDKARQYHIESIEAGDELAQFLIENTK
jgi:hypothetical protein